MWSPKHDEDRRVKLPEIGSLLIVGFRCKTDSPEGHETFVMWHAMIIGITIAPLI